jgi:hypothetical protein
MSLKEVKSALSSPNVTDLERVQLKRSDQLRKLSLMTEEELNESKDVNPRPKTRTRKFLLPLY